MACTAAFEVFYHDMAGCSVGNRLFFPLIIATITATLALVGFNNDLHVLNISYLIMPVMHMFNPGSPVRQCRAMIPGHMHRMLSCHCALLTRKVRY
jgi:hypothetical protein